MPRPRRDGTPARSEPNKRRLSEAFIKTVRPDPDRVDRVLGHSPARPGAEGPAVGPPRLEVRVLDPRAWIPLVLTSAMPGPLRWPMPASWRARSCIRSPRAEIHMLTGLRCVAGGRSSRWPNATSRSMPASGTRAGGKRMRWSPSTCCHDGPSWTSAASGGRTSRLPSRPSQPPSWRTRCWLRPARSSAGPCGRRSSLRTHASAWRGTTQPVVSGCSVTLRSLRSGPTSVPR